jgi:hypothetical protein
LGQGWFLEGGFWKVVALTVCIDPFIWLFVLLLFSFHLVLFFYSCSFLEKGYVPRSGKRWSNQIAWSPAHSVRRGLTIGALALLLLLLELLL